MYEYQALVRSIICSHSISIVVIKSTSTPANYVLYFPLWHARASSHASTDCMFRYNRPLPAPFQISIRTMECATKWHIIVWFVPICWAQCMSSWNTNTCVFVCGWMSELGALSISFSVCMFVCVSYVIFVWRMCTRVESVAFDKSAETPEQWELHSSWWQSQTRAISCYSGGILNCSPCMIGVGLIYGDNIIKEQTVFSQWNPEHVRYLFLYFWSVSLHWENLVFSCVLFQCSI